MRTSRSLGNLDFVRPPAFALTVEAKRPTIPPLECAVPLV
jgi:hypothetical protein